jgi:hypothetical protein
MSTITLMKRPDGRLRPNLAEPKTVAEARAYAEAKKMADQANDLLGAMDKVALEQSPKDNTEQDLNSEKNIVVLTGPHFSQDPRDKLEQFSTLYLDATTGKAQSFEREVTGTVYRSFTGSSGSNLNLETQCLYTASPLQLTATSHLQHPSRTGARIDEKVTLREDANGLIVFESTQSDTLNKS